jgi:transcriptional regulator with XRE-family HTH domain
MVIYGKLFNNGCMSGYSQDNPFLKQRKLLGATIKKIREDKRLTQEDLADAAEVNVSYLAKIENGYVNTTVRILIKLSKGLKVQVRDLFRF